MLGQRLDGGDPGRGDLRPQRRFARQQVVDLTPEHPDDPPNLTDRGLHLDPGHVVQHRAGDRQPARDGGHPGSERTQPGCGLADLAGQQRVQGVAGQMGQRVTLMLAQFGEQPQVAGDGGAQDLQIHLLGLRQGGRADVVQGGQGLGQHGGPGLGAVAAEVGQPIVEAVVAEIGRQLGDRLQHRVDDPLGDPAEPATRRVCRRLDDPGPARATVLPATVVPATVVHGTVVHGTVVHGNTSCRPGSPPAHQPRRDHAILVIMQFVRRNSRAGLTAGKRTSLTGKRIT
jgi:hypothetical protein